MRARDGAAGRGYYAEGLAAERLRLCYDLATPEVRRYMGAEIAHVRARLDPDDRVLELGCGYGRIVKDLAASAGFICGVDTSRASLRYGADYLAGVENVALVCADAAAPGLAPGAFDVVCCLQNGVSAFKIEPLRLFRAALESTRPGGRTLFASYAAGFWEDRLAWFRIQAEHGLVGEIDEDATGNGRIVCKDGFSATTFGADDFRDLAAACGRETRIETVAASSLFCEMTA
ncbi:class I SAM-dependent methyltransferase [bacterium]|nr:class I SAM-dependent methyltransferase [bacterium]MBU1072240.1 class I SAM-dependent methyltransferase [bacterium]MBU1676833.1 class I SAM-dependent methyltransferase [bacterium]